MTPSREESDSESGFDDESETKSSAAPLQTLPSPQDAFTSKWCVTGMRDIYTEGIQSNEGCKLARSNF